MVLKFLKCMTFRQLYWNIYKWNDMITDLFQKKQGWGEMSEV